MSRRRRRKPKKAGILKRFVRRRARNSFSTYYEAPMDPRKKTFDLSREFHNLPRETKRTILSVFILALGGILFLSLIQLAGPAGKFINSYATLAFGVGRWYVPFLLFLLGFLLLKPSKHDIKGLTFVGGVFFILSLNGFIHLLKFPQELWDGATQGTGGGFAGLALSYPLNQFIGFWGAMITLGALLAMSFFLFLNTSLPGIFSRGADAKDKLSGILPKKDKKKIPVPEPTPIEPDEEPEVEFETKEIPLEAEEEKEAAEEDLEPAVEPVMSVLPRRAHRKIEMPIDLLTGMQQKAQAGDIENNQEIIRKTLENFSIHVEMGEVNVGPTVTQYAIKPEEGVKLSRIISLSDNLALALAAHPIRIEAPIPGKSLVGIEVPNKSSAVVPLRTIIDSKEFKARKNDMMISLGKDVKGTPWLADLQKMPHMLIAGSTGSGKSVCINSLIISLLFANGPDDLWFIMVDPKRVELPMYNGIPHLRAPVITDVGKTVNALKWAVKEMEKRFDRLAEFHKRDIQSYNRDVEDKLPYIVIVIDELADLMATSGAEIEALIVRLAQMARAVGIHLVLATQRPSVDVITGLIKANITARIAFSVASLIDSRTILDMAGAEKLLGRGDMLFVSAELSKPKRLQGAFTSDEDIKRVIEHLKKAEPNPEYIPEITEKVAGSGFSMPGMPEDDGGDALLLEAKRVIIEAKKASASLLQRRLKVGYSRAARILDLLEDQGFIGPADGAKPREILARGDMGGSRPENSIVDETEEE